MRRMHIDQDYLIDFMLKLLRIPSPTGFTDEIVHFTCEELERLHVPFELTRRGAIRATLKGKQESPDRGIVTHLDTIGAMVKDLKPNGRLGVWPIGTWSARFAEGCRVTILTDHGPRRGTILPLKASGHVYHEEIDKQPTSWENLEIRVDEDVYNVNDLLQLGFNIGDFVAIDPNPEIAGSGYINTRNLDNKAGVALVTAMAKAIYDGGFELPVDCHLLFTISEEVGSGASSILHGDMAEMVAVDNGTPAPGQNSAEKGVTVSMMDSSGPFDYHLTHKLINLCRDFGIPFQRDVFKYYRTDAASAVEAGNDLRCALVCFGVDSSHGYERTHINSLVSVAELLGVYVQSPPTFQRDRYQLGPLKGFPERTN